MKRVIIFLIFIFMSFHYVSANENRIEYGGKSYTYYLDYNVYIMGTYNLERCVENPSLENFDKLCIEKYKYIRYTNYNNDCLGYIDKKTYENPDFSKDYGCINFKISALKFMENNDNLNNLLSENSIYGTVKESALIRFMWDDFDFTSHIIWLKTTQNEIYYVVPDYYFEENEHLELSSRSFEETGKLYNEDEFKSKYLWNDGSLYINGKLVEGRDNPIFMPGVCRIPIRTVLEELGYKVDYDAKNKAILAEKNNKKYAFILRTFEREDQYISDYPKDVIQVPNIYTYFRNNRFYVKAVGGLGIFFDNLGYENSNCDIDYINRNYFINIEN